MPKNKLIYYGLLVILGTAACWLGLWLTTRVEFILPYTLGAGILMVIGGAFLESKKPKEDPGAPTSGESSPGP